MGVSFASQLLTTYINAQLWSTNLVKFIYIYMTLLQLKV